MQKIKDFKDIIDSLLKIQILELSILKQDLIIETDIIKS